MKLLFDHNLSYKLVSLLADIFPKSRHVRAVGLAAASDRRVWNYASTEDLVIVSKDEDFHQLSFVRGPPPKVVWVRLGNCTTADIERALRTSRADLLRFHEDDEAAFLIVDDRSLRTR